MSRSLFGIAIYIKSNIKTKFICKAANDSEIEYMFVELFNSDDKILIGAIYRPNRLIDILPIRTIISQTSLMYSNVVISGNLNCLIIVCPMKCCRLLVHFHVIVMFPLILLRILVYCWISFLSVLCQVSCPVFSRLGLWPVQFRFGLT